MEYKFMRLCPKCRIRWMATMETRSCPKCAATPFWTTNAGDIGTCMQMDAAGLTLEDFPEWQAPPEETPNAKVEADGAASCAGRASNDGLCGNGDEGKENEL